jgi:cytochrome P450
MQCQISTSQWAASYDSDNFAEPESFSPQRWLRQSHPLYERKFSNDNKDAFRPFSVGPRDCVGKPLAYAEMRLMAARFLYRFDFTAEPGQEN